MQIFLLIRSSAWKKYQKYGTQFKFQNRRAKWRRLEKLEATALAELPPIIKPCRLLDGSATLAPPASFFMHHQLSGGGGANFGSVDQQQQQAACWSSFYSAAVAAAAAASNQQTGGANNYSQVRHHDVIFWTCTSRSFENCVTENRKM